MFKRIRKIICIIFLVTFSVTSLRSPADAQLTPNTISLLPKPGMMIHLSPEFTPAHLKGIVIHPENALKVDFIIYRGDQPLSDQEKKQEYTKLIKYFLASLAVPDDDQWVNLSPYEKDRIIKDDFGKTEMGRDLLAEDYILKQLSASLIYPQDKLGAKFWDKVYTQAQQQFGTSNIPVNTFNKVWIVPDDAQVYEKGNAVFLIKSHLKVLLEADYLSMQKNASKSILRSSTQKLLSEAGLPQTNRSLANARDDAQQIGTDVVRQIVLPELEREVNEGKNFVMLRQVFSGMILAEWYKRALKDSLLSKIYADKSKLKGVDQNPKNNQEIYEQYLKAFKKGVFNFIKEDVDKYTKLPVPRKYFSGGVIHLPKGLPTSASKADGELGMNETLSSPDVDISYAQLTEENESPAIKKDDQNAAMNVLPDNATFTFANGYEKHWKQFIGSMMNLILQASSMQQNRKLSFNEVDTHDSSTPARIRGEYNVGAMLHQEDLRSEDEPYLDDRASLEKAFNEFSSHFDLWKSNQNYFNVAMFTFMFLNQYIEFQKGNGSLAGALVHISPHLKTLNITEDQAKFIITAILRSAKTYGPLGLEINNAAMKSIQGEDLKTFPFYVTEPISISYLSAGEPSSKNIEGTFLSRDEARGTLTIQTADEGEKTLIKDQILKVALKAQEDVSIDLLNKFYENVNNLVNLTNRRDPEHVAYFLTDKEFTVLWRFKKTIDDEYLRLNKGNRLAAIRQWKATKGQIEKSFNGYSAGTEYEFINYIMQYSLKRKKHFASGSYQLADLPAICRRIITRAALGQEQYATAGADIEKLFGQLLRNRQALDVEQGRISPAFIDQMKTEIRQVVTRDLTEENVDTAVKLINPFIKQRLDKLIQRALLEQKLRDLSLEYFKRLRDDAGINFFGEGEGIIIKGDLIIPGTRRTKTVRVNLNTIAKAIEYIQAGNFFILSFSDPWNNRGYQINLGRVIDRLSETDIKDSIEKIETAIANLYSDEGVLPFQLKRKLRKEKPQDDLKIRFKESYSELPDDQQLSAEEKGFLIAQIKEQILAKKKSIRFFDKKEALYWNKRTASTINLIKIALAYIEIPGVTLGSIRSNIDTKGWELVVEVGNAAMKKEPITAFTNLPIVYRGVVNAPEPLFVPTNIDQIDRDFMKSYSELKEADEKLKVILRILRDSIRPGEVNYRKIISLTEPYWDTVNQLLVGIRSQGNSFFKADAELGLKLLSRALNARHKAQEDKKDEYLEIVKSLSMDEDFFSTPSAIISLGRTLFHPRVEFRKMAWVTVYSLKALKKLEKQDLSNLRRLAAAAFIGAGGEVPFVKDMGQVERKSILDLLDLEDIPSNVPKTGKVVITNALERAPIASFLDQKVEQRGDEASKNSLFVPDHVDLIRGDFTEGYRLLQEADIRVRAAILSLRVSVDDYRKILQSRTKYIKEAAEFYAQLREMNLPIFDTDIKIGEDLLKTYLKAMALAGKDKEAEYVDLVRSLRPDEHYLSTTSAIISLGNILFDPRPEFREVARGKIQEICSNNITDNDLLNLRRLAAQELTGEKWDVNGKNMTLAERKEILSLLGLIDDPMLWGQVKEIEPRLTLQKERDEVFRIDKDQFKPGNSVTLQWDKGISSLDIIPIGQKVTRVKIQNIVLRKDDPKSYIMPAQDQVLEIGEPYVIVRGTYKEKPFYFGYKLSEKANFKVLKDVQDLREIIRIINNDGNVIIQSTKQASSDTIVTLNLASSAMASTANSAMSVFKKIESPFPRLKKKAEDTMRQLLDESSMDDAEDESYGDFLFADEHSQEDHHESKLADIRAAENMQELIQAIKSLESHISDTTPIDDLIEEITKEAVEFDWKMINEMLNRKGVSPERLQFLAKKLLWPQEFLRGNVPLEFFESNYEGVEILSQLAKYAVNEDGKGIDRLFKKYGEEKVNNALKRYFTPFDAERYWLSIQRIEAEYFSSRELRFSYSNEKPYSRWAVTIIVIAALIMVVPKVSRKIKESFGSQNDINRVTTQATSQNKNLITDKQGIILALERAPKPVRATVTYQDMEGQIRTAEIKNIYLTDSLNRLNGIESNFLGPVQITIPMGDVISVSIHPPSISRAMSVSKKIVSPLPLRVDVLRKKVEQIVELFPAELQDLKKEVQTFFDEEISGNYKQESESLRRIFDISLRRIEDDGLREQRKALYAMYIAQLEIVLKNYYTGAEQETISARSIFLATALIAIATILFQYYWHRESPSKETKTPQPSPTPAPQIKKNKVSPPYEQDGPEKWKQEQKEWREYAQNGIRIDATKGGIDFNAVHLHLQIKRDGQGVPLSIDQQNLENIHIEGLFPVILDIKPVTSTGLLAELTSPQPQLLAKS